ncbi:MAG: GDSL-type esterase/lipase family protein [Ignavibacteriaceae bacterium]
MNRIKPQFISFLFILLIPFVLYSQVENPIRVACVGNSITEGIALTNPAMDSYPVDLGRFLGGDYTVRNFGKSGRTLLKKGDFPIWNEQVFTDAINFDPNIIIIMLGTNDSKPQNWVYKDEFLSDYCAMIDTFKQGAANPEIFVCYPLPAFSSAYDIRDTIIVADIIPIIEHIVDSLNVSLIDFYSPFLDKGHLLPDGIHPLVEGSELMAKIVYEALKGKSIELKTDVNTALNKKVFLDNNEITELVDNDQSTNVVFNSGGKTVIIDLINEYNTDMINIHLPGSFPVFSFVISISKDSVEWVTTIDTSIGPGLTGDFFTAKFESADIRFVKFEIPDGGIQPDSTVTISEMQVFESQPFHAPALRSETVTSSSSSNRLKLYISMTSKTGELVKVYKQAADNAPFELAYNYRSNDPWEFTLVLPFGTLNRFYAVAYYDAVEIQSDTLTIISSLPTDVGDNKSYTAPDDYYLSQNYPNPFNPETLIEFSIPISEVVTIEIYNAAGKLIRTIGNYTFPAGNHQVKWDGKNPDGISSASGVYFYRLVAADKVIQNKKMILLR